MNVDYVPNSDLYIGHNNDHLAVYKSVFKCSLHLTIPDMLAGFVREAAKIRPFTNGPAFRPFPPPP